MQNLEGLNQSKEESYNKIITDIKAMYHNKISESESHAAARNLIEFVKIMLKYAEKK